MPFKIFRCENIKALVLFLQTFGADLTEYKRNYKSRALTYFLSLFFYGEVLWTYFYGLDLMLQMAQKILQKHIFASIIIFLSFFNTYVHAHCLYLIRHYNTDINFLISHLAVETNPTNYREKKQKKRRGDVISGVNTLMMAILAIKILQGLSMQIHFLFKNHTFPMATVLPVNKYNPWTILAFFPQAVFGALTTTKTVFVFQWLFMLFMRLLSLKFEEAREDLKRIVKTLTFHLDKGVCFRMKSPDDENITLLLPADENPTEYKECMKQADKMLDEWIKNHIFLLELFRKMSGIFSYVSALRSLNAYMLMMSIICIRLNNPGTRDGVRVAWYAVINLYAFYLMCKDGQKLNDTSSEVVKSAMAKGWYLHPVQFQKKLLTVCTFVNNRPCEVTFVGLFALNMEAFLNVMVLSHEMISFLDTIL